MLVGTIAGKTAHFAYLFVAVSHQEIEKLKSQGFDLLTVHYTYLKLECLALCGLRCVV